MDRDTAAAAYWWRPGCFAFAVVFTLVCICPVNTVLFAEAGTASGCWRNSALEATAETGLRLSGRRVGLLHRRQVKEPDDWQPARWRSHAAALAPMLDVEAGGVAEAVLPGGFHQPQDAGVEDGRVSPLGYYPDAGVVRAELGHKLPDLVEVPRGGHGELELVVELGR